MTQATPAPTATSATAAAMSVVDLGVRACAAYGRPDLAARLNRSREALADPSIHIVVAGEFKQGKSSLVNALLGANVCPVDDDVATAVPTFIRYGEENAAALVHDGDPPRKSPSRSTDIRKHVVEGVYAGARAGPGRGLRPPQDARRRPRHGRHSRRRRARFRPRRRRPRRDLRSPTRSSSSPTPRRS